MIVAWAALPNGTKIEYGAQANYAMYPTRITDAQGNFITITYLNNEGPKIQTITDTLGRVSYFHYDLSGLLTSIVVPGLNGGSRVAVRLQYQPLWLSNAGANYGFAGGLTTKVRQNPISVIKAIYYPGTSTGYWFGDDGDSYSPYGMIRKVSERRGMTFDNAPLDQQGNIGPGVMSHEMVYDYPLSGGSYTDMPTYGQLTEDWAGRTTASTPETYFSVVDSGGQRTTTITRMDGAQLKQLKQISDLNTGMLLEDGLYQGEVALSRSKAFWEIGAYDSPRPTRTEVWDERGQVTATNYSYDPDHGSRYNSPTDVRVFGYNNELLRRTHTEYLNNDNYNGLLLNSGTTWWKAPGVLSGGPIWRGQHIFNLVTLTEVYAEDDVTRLSRTEYQYDGPGLVNAPGIAQHDSRYNPYTPPVEQCDYMPDPSDPDCISPVPCVGIYPECDGVCPNIYVCNQIQQYDSWLVYFRGNVTQVKRYADAGSLDQGTAVVETRTYDIAGNVREQTTSCCEKTTFTYTTNTQYAWPESQTSGSPSDATKQNTASATYDYNTGLVMTSTDANDRVSQTVYDPNTLRPVSEYSPTGAYQYHIYNDTDLWVVDLVYEYGLDGNNFASRSEKYLDGLGRVIKEVAYGRDYVTWDAVETRFDNLGRVSQQTRPYRIGAETPQWSAVTYDLLDRPIQTTSPDGSIVTRAYNQNPDPPGSSGQPGQTIKVTDPWGRERWARSDALGRLVEVAEPDPNGNGSLSAGVMYTTYSFDALDRLVQVSQGAQARNFRYDSLGRLTHQKLAERDATLNDNGQWVGSGQWGDVFFYDTRSNLIRRVEARGVQTHYNFNDPLNRLLSVTYDKSGVPGHLSPNIPDTPNVTYGYMTTHDKMRAATVTVGNGMGNESLSYDSERRLSQVSQTFTGREGYPILTNYIWDSLDRLRESTYPQQYGAGEIRNKVEPAYDIASRLESLKFGGVTYASNPVYNAASQTTSLDVGSQIKEFYNYDPKTGLMTNQQVKRGADILVDLKYNYTLTNDANNNGAKTGQLTSITDLKNQARNRAYEYDKLGRLLKAKGGADAFNNPAWSQSYLYDRYGNRNLVGQDGEFVWSDDAVPAGASTEYAGFDGGENWSWTSNNPIPYSGAVSHQSGVFAGIHRHFFYGATTTMQVEAGDKLYAYVYLDPANMPSEVMLEWNDGGGWEHRAYWGANNIPCGTDGTESRRYVGPLPQAGVWTRLEVPASAVGLEGKTVSGMSFTLHGGRANWDKTGKVKGSGSPVPLDGLSKMYYNLANNRITNPGFEYDPAGNQTKAVVAAGGAQQQYRYDCAGRLAQVLDGAGNVLATHAYGAGNRRLMSVEGGVTKYFAWAGGQIIVEYEASGANALVWKTSYVYLGGKLLATTSGADGSETRFHHPDRLGTRIVTNAAGTVVTEQWTLPFGNMQPFTSVPGGENPYQHPTLANPSKKRFTSYDRSDATGLDYAVNRFYSSQQGRFTQVDPIGMGAASLSNPQTLNMYAYCGNDPINHVDPDGLFFGWIGKAFKWIARVAAVVLAVAAVLAVVWSGNPFIAVSAWKLALGAAKFALDGWGNSKWTRILSAGIGAFLGFKLGKVGRTPNTFPFAEGASAARSWVLAAVGAVYSFLAQQGGGRTDDACGRMAREAEWAADRAIQEGIPPGGGTVLDTFDVRFSRQYIGHRMSTLSDAADLYWNGINGSVPQFT